MKITKSQLKSIIKEVIEESKDDSNKYNVTAMRNGTWVIFNNNPLSLEEAEDLVGDLWDSTIPSVDKDTIKKIKIKENNYSVVYGDFNNYGTYAKNLSLDEARVKAKEAESKDLPYVEIVDDNIGLVIEESKIIEEGRTLPQGVKIVSRETEEPPTYRKDGSQLLPILPIKEEIVFDIDGIEYILKVDRSDDNYEMEWTYNGELYEVPEQWEEIEDFVTYLYAPEDVKYNSI